MGSRLAAIPKNFSPIYTGKRLRSAGQPAGWSGCRCQKVVLVVIRSKLRDSTGQSDKCTPDKCASSFGSCRFHCAGRRALFLSHPIYPL